MARLERRRWNSETALELGLPRRDRRSCSYDAYIPDKLSHRRFAFDGAVTADLTDAEHSIVRLDQHVVVLVDTEALARLLLRAEAVASSKIEGLEIGARRLLRADASRQQGEQINDVTAIDVLANIDALSFATSSVGKGDPITLALLLEVHQRLLATSRHKEHAGRIRTLQNWIGGSSFNPCSAEFIPPSPELVKGLLQDLCVFCNSDTLPAVAQAAIAHAQFETIHPFADGNGRVGRALIYMVLRRRALISRTIPPISLVLATRSKDYMTGLNATRYSGQPESSNAADGTNRWVGIFASACSRAVVDTEAFEERIRDLEGKWRKRLGSVRAGSAADRLLKKLPGTPILTVQSAAALIGRSVQAVNEAIPKLLEHGILSPITSKRRHRAFEAKELVAAFTDLERRLASPAGDTRISRPTRRVPYRRRLAQ